MSKITQLCIMLYTNLVCGMKALKEEERGAVDIVAIVVMIGVAVLLAVVFKEELAKLLRARNHQGPGEQRNHVGSLSAEPVDHISAGFIRQIYDRKLKRG